MRVFVLRISIFIEMVFMCLFFVFDIFFVGILLIVLIFKLIIVMVREVVINLFLNGFCMGFI